MPKELHNPFQKENSLNAELAAELEKVAALIQERAGAEPLPESAVALVRVLRNVSPEEWEEFASTHGFSDWLSLSLQDALAGSVEHLLATQENLIYQRDHDSLTGLANRRCFLRQLHAEVERAKRSYTELSLIYLDLDDFKRVNDTYGHACGDIVLKRLAHILRTSVRHYDITARIGGEEFVVLLPASSCWTGVMLANRLLDLFRSESFSCDGRSFSMTFSAGVSSLALLEEHERNGDSLMRSADKAMYEAKGKGKNAIVLTERSKMAKDKASLVLAQEKQFLFSGSTLE